MTTKPWRSGWCNNPASVHAQCDQNRRQDGVPCCCGCHQPEEDATPALSVVKPTPNVRELPDLIQGTEEWHDQRRGMVTASVVGKLLTSTLTVASNETSRGVTATLVAERITGVTEDTGMTPDMWRGVEHEPLAREVYAKHHAPVEEIGFIVREEPTWTLGYSPDGLVGSDGLIEIKCPRAKTHLTTILSGEVPGYYMAQCQAGLLVSGRDWIDFVSFFAGLPLWVKRVTPDPLWHHAITAATEAFEINAAAMVAAYRPAITGLAPTERADLEIRI